MRVVQTVHAYQFVCTWAGNTARWASISFPEGPRRVSQHSQLCRNWPCWETREERVRKNFWECSRRWLYSVQCVQWGIIQIRVKGMLLNKFEKENEKEIFFKNFTKIFKYNNCSNELCKNRQREEEKEITGLTNYSGCTVRLPYRFCCIRHQKALPSPTGRGSQEI